MHHVRVVPEQSGLLADLEARRPGRPRLDHLMRPAVGLRWDVEPVPVQGTRDVERVRHAHAHLVSRAHPQRRSEEGAVDPDGRRRPPGEELRLARLQRQIEHAAAGIHAAIVQSRNGKGLGRWHGVRECAGHSGPPPGTGRKQSGDQAPTVHGHGLGLHCRA